MPLPPSTGTGLFVLNGDGVTKGLRGEHACAPIGAPVGMRSRRPFCDVAPPAPRGGARSSPPSIGGAIHSRRRRRAPAGMPIEVPASCAPFFKCATTH